MKRSFKLSIAAVAIMAVLCSGAAFADVTAKKTTGVKYRADGVEHTTPSDKDVYIIDDTFDPNNGDNMKRDWYVVQGHPKFTTPLWFKNSSGVNIILADGATLDIQIQLSGVTNHFGIQADGVMTIYAQSTDRATMGCISMVTNTDIGYSSDVNIRAIEGNSSIIMHGGIVKTRAMASMTGASYTSYALLSGYSIVVGAEAVVEAYASADIGNAYAIAAQNYFISSGDVTATATAGNQCYGIFVKNFVVSEGVCRSVTTGIRTLQFAEIKGGWVDSALPMGSLMTTHTGGALIDGDTGTVSGDAVIPAGMAATLRDGVTLTFNDDAKLIVEQGATLDASKGTLANAANKITNNGVVELPTGTTISDLGMTGSGVVEMGGKLYDNGGVEVYTIKVTNDDGHGISKADRSVASKDITVTLTATPNIGYVFDEWVVVEPTSLKIEGDGTFKMPDEAVEVKAMFKALPPTPTPAPTPSYTPGKYIGAIDSSKTDGLWDARAGQDMTIHINVEFSEFENVVSLDGVPLVIDTASVSNDFGARAGSTIVTIWEKTLREHITTDGEHTAEVGFTDGSAIHSFTVRGTGETPPQKQNTSGGACATGAAAIAASIGLAIRRRGR